MKAITNIIKKSAYGFLEMAPSTAEQQTSVYSHFQYLEIPPVV